MKTRFVKMPNTLILEKHLKPSRKRVYQALLANQRNGQVRRTYAELAERSGCSVGTVRQSVDDLSNAGYISIKKNYWFSEATGQLLKDTCVYTITPQDFSQGYTMVPCKLLQLCITHSAYLVALYLLKLIGVSRRAWPSLRRGFQRALGMSRTTICEAIKQLMECKILVRLRCLTANRVYSMSSYILTLWGEGNSLAVSGTTAMDVEASASYEGRTETDSFCHGGPFFDKHPLSTKITWGYIRRKKEKGVCEFVKFHKKTFRTQLRLLLPRPPNRDTSR